MTLLAVGNGNRFGDGWRMAAGTEGAVEGVVNGDNVGAEKVVRPVGGWEVSGWCSVRGFVFCIDKTI